MLSSHTKICIIFLLFVATFTTQSFSAPAPDGPPPPDDSANSKSDEDKVVKVPGEWNGAPKLSTLVDTSQKPSVELDVVSSPVPPPSPPKSHARVKRNKHPIRYHAKTIRREK